MPARIRLFTDPACSASWAAEPRLRRLLVEFGEEVRITYVMGGLARRLEGDLPSLARAWLDTSERSGMPIDPRAWLIGEGLRSTFPACMAVKAAAEQGEEAAGRLLRGLREGIMCRRRRLDSAEPLVEEARLAGLDVQRFRVDLESNAIVEAFGADLEQARVVPDVARERGLAADGPAGERLAFPALRFTPEGDDGVESWCGGNDPYERWRDAALAAGAQPAPGTPPAVLEALGRFGRMATVEVAAACGLPGPRAAAELWHLAAEWRVRPERYLTGELWEPA